MEKCLFSDTVTHSIRDDVKEFMEVFPTDKVIQITLDYLANDTELREIIAYFQSEEYPMIHKIVEYLKQYKYVSAFMCMFLKHQSDRENICSVSTGGWIALF